MLVMATRRKYDKERPPTELAPYPENDPNDYINPVNVAICAFLGILCLCLILGLCYFHKERKKRQRRRRRDERNQLQNAPPYHPNRQSEFSYGVPFHNLMHNGTGNVDINLNRGIANPVFSEEDRQPMQHSNDDNCSNVVDDMVADASCSYTERPRELETEQQPETTTQLNAMSDDELFGCSEKGELFQPSLKELSVISDRSITRTIANKLVVFVTHFVDHRGDILYLDNMGISLQVPPGAVKHGERKCITLLLNWDLGDNPYMSNRQALVSPVVFVGPHGLKLQKHCLLTYKHCSFDARHIQVMQSETDLVGQKNWGIMCKPDDTSAACVITPDECQLKISTFTLYTCLQQAPEDQTGGKWVQIAVFSTPLNNLVCHQQVRIYFLNKTNCALQWAIHNESRFGGRLICPEKLFLLYGSEHDMVISLTYLCEGWDIIDGQVERIPYFQVWHGKCPHVSMCLKKRSSRVHELNFSMEVFQEKRKNQMERLVVQAIEDRFASNSIITGVDPVCLKHRVTIHCPKEFPSKVKVEQHQQCSAVDSDNTVQVEIIGPNYPEIQCTEAIEGQRLIPENVRVKLKVLLDVQNPVAKNWKFLAEKLGYDEIIPYLESKVSSPTEFLLGVVENKKITIHQLMDMLVAMDRRDAAEVLEDCIDTEQKTTREPVENDLNDDVYKRNI